MTRNLQIALAAFAIFSLTGIGVLVDRFGYVEIRTDGSDRAISLLVPSPLLLGVPVSIRWEGYGSMEDRAIDVRLITKQGTVPFGAGTLLSGLKRITIPCTSPLDSARFELVETQTGKILASAPAQFLPPGPDCIR